MVVRKGLSGVFAIVTSPAIIAELREKLSVKFGLPSDDVREYLRVIAIHATFVEPREEAHIVVADRSDDKIVACALTGDAHYIVTGDKHLLSLKGFSSVRIVTPAVFLKLL